MTLMLNVCLCVVSLSQPNDIQSYSYKVLEFLLWVEVYLRYKKLLKMYRFWKEISPSPYPAPTSNVTLILDDNCCLIKIYV